MFSQTISYMSALQCFLHISHIFVLEFPVNPWHQKGFLTSECPSFTQNHKCIRYKIVLLILNFSSICFQRYKESNEFYVDTLSIYFPNNGAIHINLTLIHVMVRPISRWICARGNKYSIKRIVHRIVLNVLLWQYQRHIWHKAITCLF